MYLIVGLGNPSKQYEKTRHNIGFDVIDALADKYNISVTEKKHKALCGKGTIEGRKVVLAKPQTFMNLSGESVVELLNYYKMDPESEMIVIFEVYVFLLSFTIIKSILKHRFAVSAREKEHIVLWRNRYSNMQENIYTTEDR